MIVNMLKNLKKNIVKYLYEDEKQIINLLFNVHIKIYLY